MHIFFYGLFMDEKLLAKKTISPFSAMTGFVDGYKLRIGDRATLLHHPGNRVYGMLMDVAADDVTKLYAQPGVSDYVPESVTVETVDRSKFDAICYNLPLDQVTGTNKEYARSLLKLATQLKLPGEYLEQIAQANA